MEVEDDAGMWAASSASEECGAGRSETARGRGALHAGLPTSGLAYLVGLAVRKAKWEWERADGTLG